MADSVKAFSSRNSQSLTVLMDRNLYHNAAPTTRPLVPKAPPQPGSQNMLRKHWSTFLPEWADISPGWFLNPPSSYIMSPPDFDGAVLGSRVEKPVPSPPETGD